MIYKINTEQLLEIFSNESTITAAAREYCRINNMEYDDKIRRKCSHIINRMSNTTDTVTETIQYDNDVDKPVTLEARDSDGTLMNIDRFCEVHGLDRSSIRSYKLVSHTSRPYYNIAFKSSQEEEVYNILEDREFLENLIDSKIQRSEIVSVDIDKTSPVIDRLIISDVHINLDNHGGPNIESLYDENRYTKEEIRRRLDDTISHVIKHRKSNSILVDNLGDFMDGLGGQTTRGGHQLPQMYSDKEAFQIAVDFQIHLIENLLLVYDKVVANNITNDNHSFLMGYFVHVACKRILENKYPGRVEYNILEKFMHHYSVPGHTFILTHGKDAQDMKFGMKLFLDAPTIQKIDHYCKHNLLYNGNLIEVSKGDLHSFVQDCTTSKDFEYVNYPAFSPSSNWVQTNFGKQKSGIVFQNIDCENGVKTTIPLWF